MIGIIFILLVLIVLYSFMIRDLISRIHTQSFECTSFKELYDKAKMPIVPLTIFGKIYHFIIDTGADLNLIRTSFANDLPEGFLYEIEGSNVTGAGGDINTSQGADLEVEFEGYDFNVNVEVMPIDNALDLVGSKAGIEIIGILGNPFLHDNKWMLDFSKKLIWTKRL